MAYLRRPIEEEEAEGQQTSFMTSQGPGMAGAGGGAGGLGVAGGALTGRTPFINPEDIARRNVGAGQRLGQRLEETFITPAGRISKQIGKEQGDFATAAKKQKLDYGEHFKPLGTQTAQTPMGIGGAYDPESKTFTDDMAELQRRLALQYTGPTDFQASSQVTDPLTKFKERVGAYGVRDPGTGIEQSSQRQSLIGEIMSPTSTGGTKSLEEYLLTSSPDALQSLINQIRGLGQSEPLGEGAGTTQFAGYQGVSAPVARLNRARRDLADLVERRQKAAAKTQELTRRDVGLGMDVIQSGVTGDITQAIADAKERERLITGGYIDPEDRGEDFKLFSQLPELFSGAYGEKETPEEWALAKRLGLRTQDPDTGEWTDQVPDIQRYLQGLLNPYADEKLGGFLDPDAFQGDEVTGVDYRTLDPLQALFTALNPENVYTREQMIGEQEAQRLGGFQQLLRPGEISPIVRAEGALGSEGRSIETKDIQAWMDQLAGFQQEKTEKAEGIRSDRAKADFVAKVGDPPTTSGNYQVDKENWFQYNQRIQKAQEEMANLNFKIAEFDKWTDAHQVALDENEGDMAGMQKWYDVNGETPGVEVSIFDRINSFLDSGWAQDMKDQADAGAQAVEDAETDRKEQQKRKKKGFGSTGGLTGTDVTTPAGGTFTTTNPGANL